MFSPDDIEYVGPVAGGVEVVLRGDYVSDAGRREQRRIEFSRAAARLLCERLARLTSSEEQTP